MNNPLSKPTLVMGARAGIGRLILDDLIARDVPVRASTRRPEPGQLPAGVEAVAADLTDRASLEAAFAGIGQAFLFANHEGVEGVIEAAHAAGLERIVLLSSGSVIHPTSLGNKITEEHREVEQALTAAGGFALVPIRPLVLATNDLGWSYPIRATGSVSIYQPDALTAPVHEADIAAVAVAALMGNDDVTGILTGPDRLSQRAQVASISAAAGKEFSVVELSRDEAAANVGRFMPAWEAEAVLQFLDDAAAGNSGVSDTVERVLGRPAIEFAEWAVDHADDFR
ncbi:NAD(P)H-binding protein [Glaciihabitans sp. dw_435]|uniref:NAD(P)H-binding protein n=1 Tax=Glaciihabitans sp. dw_435 TaxID=2720081 RepID=UPI001BD2FA71|nr:NAD(P)H-binding protein [Glaciihabitans sp. dw_435]